MPQVMQALLNPHTNLQSALCTLHSAICNLHSAICNLQSVLPHSLSRPID